MAEWAPRRFQRAALAEVEAALMKHGESAEGRYARGCCLRVLGRFAEAADDFLRTLDVAPAHRESALAYVAMLIALGRLREAQIAIAALSATHSRDPEVLVAAGNIWSVEDPSRARYAFEAVLDIDRENIDAERGLCVLAAGDGDRECATVHRGRGYRFGAERPLPYYGDRLPIAALALVSTDGGNLAIASLLDPMLFFTSELAVEAADPQLPLPPHALVLTAFGDVERAPNAVAASEALLTRTSRPIINHPRSLARTRRTDLADQLRAIGVRMPSLGSRSANDIWPPDDNRDERVDRYFCTYRVMFVGQELLPLHLWISPSRNMHDAEALMTEHPALRQEDARFLHDMPSALGPRAMHALQSIRETLALDVAGINFSLDRDGNVVVLEANAAVNLSAPQAGPSFDYRRPAFERILVSLRALMLDRAATGT